MFLFYACNGVLAVSSNTLQVDLMKTISTQPTQETLPNDLISKIVDLTDTKTSFSVGMVSKELNKMTENRNKRNRLIKIRKYCGFDLYTQLTSSGYQVVSKNIHDNRFGAYYGHSTTQVLIKETFCTRALTSNFRDIGHKFTELNLIVPSVIAERSQELDNAVVSYFKALDRLLEKKSIFQKVSVTSIHVVDDGRSIVYRFTEEYTYQNVESMIIDRLSRLTIDYIIFQFKIRNPHLFVNPTVKKLSAQGKFFSTDNYSDLKNLSSILYPKFDIIHVGLLRLRSKLHRLNGS
jgi:hypothetical protein